MENEKRILLALIGGIEIDIIGDVRWMMLRG